MIDPLILARGIHFAATIVACGTVSFVALVAQPAASIAAAPNWPGLRRRMNIVVWSALAVAIASGFIWLALFAADILGAPIIDVCRHGGIFQVAGDTRFGTVWCARLLLALALGVTMLWPSSRALQLILAALLIASLALIGHAGATPGLAGRIHLASDIIHLLAAAAWLGGLPALVMLLGSAPDEAAIAATRRFSLLGIASVGALLASGALNSWNLLSGPRDLLTSDYGRLVLAKIVLFAGMIAIAAVNRYRLTPHLPAPAARRALRRNSLCEIGLGLGAIAAVGALGTLQPSAHRHTPLPAIPPEAAFVHIHSSEAMADVTIDPGRAGTVNVTVHVSREDFTPFAAKEVRLEMDPPGQGLRQGQKTVVSEARPKPDGAWTIERLEIGQPGIWALRVIVNSGAEKPIVLDAPVVIER